MSLQIRLLGELEVLRGQQRVDLPASRKSRALLAYLAATRKPHLRERLCELLWEGPDDPRAALRWSLTKLRPIVEPHLVASREHVEFNGADIDIAQISNVREATTETLEQWAAMFRGEFLDGLDLPACFRYQQWCVAERERWRQTHVSILGELSRRHGVSDRALPYARKRVMIDPFDDDAHAALIRLLAKLGHWHDALAQYEHCRTLFERELGKRVPTTIEDARREIGNVGAGFSPLRDGLKPVPTSPVPTSLIGRDAEIRTIEESGRAVLILGEAGIGKSRLLEELGARARSRGGVALYARARATEMIRPFGAWIDILEPLGGLPDESDRTRLFDAVVQRLSTGVTILLDDLQWIDESSAALLNYVWPRTRSSRSWRRSNRSILRPSQSAKTRLLGELGEAAGNGQTLSQRCARHEWPVVGCRWSAYANMRNDHDALPVERRGNAHTRALGRFRGGPRSRRRAERRQSSLRHRAGEIAGRRFPRIDHQRASRSAGRIGTRASAVGGGSRTSVRRGDDRSRDGHARGRNARCAAEARAIIDHQSIQRANLRLHA